MKIGLVDRVRLRVGGLLLLAAGLFRSSGGRHKAAEEAYREALFLDPGLDTARELLGYSLEEQGRFGEAALVYAEVVERDPKGPNGYYHRGYCYLEMGRLGDAEEDCRRVIALYAKHAAAHAVLAQALERQGRREEALKAVERAVVLKPRDLQIVGLRDRMQSAGAIGR